MFRLTGFAESLLPTKLVGCFAFALFCFCANSSVAQTTYSEILASMQEDVESPGKDGQKEIEQKSEQSDPPDGEDENTGESDSESVESEDVEKWLAPGEPRKLEVEFGNGFTMASEDEEFELTFHILNQVDYKAFSPSDQEPGAID